MDTKIETQELSVILAENYYRLGTTGSQAIEAMWGDIAGGYFDEQCIEWGITMDELIAAVNTMTNRITEMGWLFVAASPLHL